MNIQHLKEFIQLAKTENYLEASELLFISQSTLSKHIQQLEKDLDISLFDRSTRKVKLSDAGRIFFNYALDIIEKQHQAKTELINLKNAEEHTLNIGSIPLMAPYHITDVLVSFRKSNPKISLNIQEGETNTLINLLKEKKLDLIFVREQEPYHLEDLIRIPFTQDYLVAVLPNSHPRANQALINLYDLKSEDFLLLQPGSVLNRLSIEACQKAGFLPNVSYTGKRAENIIDLVEKGMGVSLLMQKPISTFVSGNVKLVPVIPEVYSDICVYYRKHDLNNKIIQHFCEFLQ